MPLAGFKIFGIVYGRRFKIKKLIAIILAGVVVSFSAIMYFTASPIYCRLYRGDRITGRVHMNVDNESYVLDEKNFYFPDSGKAEINDEGDAYISFKAEEYGTYELVITDTPAEAPITLHIFKSNWWDIRTFSMNIDINTMTGDIRYTGSSSCRLGNGKKSSTIIPPRYFSGDKFKINL